MADNVLRYVRTDYQSHRDALIQRVRARWPGVWNDFFTSSVGSMLIDLIAWSTATMAFLINRAAAENYIPTMTLRESAVRIGAFVGYQLRGPTPASLSCEATLASAATSAVTIAEGALLRVGADAVPFEVAQDYVIAAGKVSPETRAVVISSELTGAKTLSTNVVVTGGSTYADLVDSSIDLNSYVQAGQTFRQLPVPTTGVEEIYTIQSIEAAPGAVSYNRLVISPAWHGQKTTDVAVTGSQAELAAEVYDRRIRLVQGQTLTDQFITPSAETPAYSVKLSHTPVIDGSIEVTVNGEPWYLVTSLATADSAAQAFEVRTLPTGQTLVLFGDGQFGSLVSQDAAVVVTYRIGGGIQGNVAIGSVNVSVAGTSVNGLVVVPLRNETAGGQGGREAETLEEARVQIPYYVRTNDRAVTLDDYQTIAQSYSHSQMGSVAYARAAVRTENSLLEGNMVVIYAWTTGANGGLENLTLNMKEALREFVQAKAVGTDYVLIADGTDLPVPISLRFKTFEGFDVVSTQDLVNSTIRSFISNLRPGQSVVHSNLLRAIDEVYGVDTVAMATPTSDLNTANPTELFTPPDDEYIYTLERTAGILSHEYTVQLPASPLAAWSFRAFLNGVELAVVPDTAPGYARLLGGALLTTRKSVVNLLNGSVKFYTTSSGSFQVMLNYVQGYDRERAVNIYVGYSGDNSLSKRREVQSALRSWCDNLAVGAAIYAGDVTRAATEYDTPGITISKSNIAAVVAAVSGVTSVNRVALVSPANVDFRVTATDYELLKAGLVVLNNSVS
jgi:hypothetical protein